LDALKKKTDGEKLTLCFVFSVIFQDLFVCLPYTSLRKVDDETIIFKNP